jgi:hypothetical protein
LRSGESYLAGGAALGEAIGSARISRDLDLFHDTREAVHATAAADRGTIEGGGYAFEETRDRPGFIEARVSDGRESVVLQWTQDSAFRFMPLLEHSDFGLVLHPVDLATNKLLAAVGRLEVRDWIDLIESCEAIQPLGYLAWAACGKDPGFSPASILAHAARTAHYSQAEIDALDFAAQPPDAAALARRWRVHLEAASQVVRALPAPEAGRLVLGGEGAVYRGSPEELQSALTERRIQFHAGTLRGAWPKIVPA